MTEIAEGTEAILNFLFVEITPEHWWTRSESTDSAIRDRFAALYEEWHTRPAEDFLATPRSTLAAVILFDQFTRNMFRHQARSFATDGLALALAKRARDLGYDADMTTDEKSMLYMPFQHSEQLIDQDRSVDMFGDIGGAPYEFAVKHRRMIVQFGRFPARNAALGRADADGEAEAIAESADW